MWLSGIGKTIIEGHGYNYDWRILEHKYEICNYGNMDIAIVLNEMDNRDIV